MFPDSDADPFDHDLELAMMDEDVNPLVKRLSELANNKDKPLDDRRRAIKDLDEACLKGAIYRTAYLGPTSSTS
jgi:hypothetical protein